MAWYSTLTACLPSSKTMRDNIPDWAKMSTLAAMGGDLIGHTINDFAPKVMPTVAKNVTFVGLVFLLPSLAMVFGSIKACCAFKNCYGTTLKASEKLDTKPSTRDLRSFQWGMALLAELGPEVIACALEIAGYKEEGELALKIAQAPIAPLVKLGVGYAAGTALAGLFGIRAKAAEETELSASLLPINSQQPS